HKLIDFGMGHGSLILGHNDPEITAALVNQAPNGTHFSAGHEGEVRWAEKIVELIPSAELVRFTASGTESTLLAMRVARGYTGKKIILKFEGHFHGWQDYALKGEKPPFEKTTVPGIPEETLSTVAVLPSNDLAMLEERLVQGDIAAVIVEPSGGSWTSIPLQEDFLQGVRALTEKHDALLIFDEVITGFRWSPGGAQQRFGVTPDITTMAKIVAGGMPGGAVGGKREVMEMIAFRDDDPEFNKTKRVPQAGTYNANPLAAAAGTTMLGRCADPAVQEQCDASAAKLRKGMNETIVRLDIPAVAWGESSVFHIAVGQPASNIAPDDIRAPEGLSPEYLKGSGGSPLGMRFEIGALVEGVHLFHAGGMLATVHTDSDLDQTVQAVERVLSRMKDEGAFA
ncbi:MAG TPA: aminotransferase class III-fold pyridoxal phosphate-dependent enzyme, partial [Thermomicrobiales bacterium]|nr:aminotransferase class III-fold pyridoxal phosphate-dependent enzyme [Thermomicrobiales bacterium]